MAYHRANRIFADAEEMQRRWQEAAASERETRKRFEHKAETYYESALEQHRVNELAKEPWRELLAWAEAEGLAGRFPDKIAHLRRRVTPTPPPDQSEFEGHFDEDVAEFYLDNGDLDRLIPLLDANDIPYDTHEFPTGKEVMTVDTGDADGPWVIELGSSLTYWRDTREWLESASDRPHEFYEDRDESEEFWADAGSGFYLYHATEEDNVDAILRDGLEARSDTRGLSNKDIGPAVFAVSGGLIDDLHAVLGPYGDAIIRIDIGAMKADGYTPEITGETPLQEAEMMESLARAIDYEYEAERESDYMEDTVAILGDIPSKYLSLHKD